MTYFVKLLFWHGDADREENQTLTFETEVEVRLVLAVWKNAQDIARHGALTWEKLHRIPGYLDIFTSRKYDLAEGEEDPLTLEKLEKGWGEDYWPKDLLYSGAPCSPKLWSTTPEVFIGSLEPVDILPLT